VPAAEVGPRGPKDHSKLHSDWAAVPQQNHRALAPTQVGHAQLLVVSGQKWQRVPHHQLEA
jgi:hypothetical protein